MVVNGKNIVSSFLLPVATLAVACTVLMVDNKLTNGVVSRKYFWFYAAIGIYTVIFSLFIFRHIRSVKVSIPDCLIICYGIITLYISIHINHSDALTRHILLAMIIVFYLFTRFSFRAQPASRYAMATGLLMTCVIEVVWGLLQLYGFTESHHVYFNLTGSFFNPGPYACYMAIILPIALYYALRNSSCCFVRYNKRYLMIYSRWVISIMVCLGAIILLPASMSRASWLAALTGCGYILFLNFVPKKDLKSYFRLHKKKCLLLFVIGGILLAGCFAGMYFMKKDSADGRALIWKISLHTIIRNPSGVGIGNFSGSYGREQAAYFAAGKGSEQEKSIAGNPEYAFNEYLQVCTEQGILPFGLLILIMAYSLYSGIKHRKTAPTAALLALLTVCTMSYPFSILPFLILLAFLLAWIHADEKGITAPSLASGLVLTGIMTIAVGLYNRYPTYHAYKKWYIYQLYGGTTYPDITDRYKELYPLLKDQLPFLFGYAQLLAQNEMYENSNRVLEKASLISCDPMICNIMGKNYQAQKKYSEAERSFRQSAFMVPNRIYPYYLLALLFVETGEMQKAEEAARIVLTKEPKVLSTAVIEMRDKMTELINIKAEE